jgi:hypothetical protein
LKDEVDGVGDYWQVALKRLIAFSGSSKTREKTLAKPMVHEYPTGSSPENSAWPKVSRGLGIHTLFVRPK